MLGTITHGLWQDHTNGACVVGSHQARPVAGPHELCVWWTCVLLGTITHGLKQDYTNGACGGRLLWWATITHGLRQDHTDSIRHVKLTY